METKLLTLQAIYDLVKDNPHPATTMVQTSELILKQNFPWDEVSGNLQELQADGFVSLKQLSTAAIFLTEKGLQYIFELFPAD
jgi:Mn-dependent DtxR family transcriptional regulator